MTSDADQILTRVKAAYAGCRSYKDEGVVTTTSYSPRKRTERRPFSTKFIRPLSFVFEFRSRRGEDDWDQYAIWIEDSRVRTWWSLKPEREDAESLKRALAGATGISRGSASRVPRLLLPDSDRCTDQSPKPGACVIDVPEAARLNCVVVERPLGFGRIEQVWIESSSFLIRRVVEPRHTLAMSAEMIEQMKTRLTPEQAAEIAKRIGERTDSEQAEVESVTTYDASFDVDIDPRELVYVPQAE